MYSISHTELTNFFPCWGKHWGIGVTIPFRANTSDLVNQYIDRSWEKSANNALGGWVLWGTLKSCFSWLLCVMEVVGWSVSLRRESQQMARKEIEIKSSWCSWETKTSTRSWGYLLQRLNVTKAWIWRPKLWGSLQSTLSHYHFTRLLAIWVQLGVFELHLWRLLVPPKREQHHPSFRVVIHIMKEKEMHLDRLLKSMVHEKPAN